MIKRLNIPGQGHGVDVIALVDQILKAAVERRGLVTLLTLAFSIGRLLKPMRVPWQMAGRNAEP